MSATMANTASAKPAAPAVASANGVAKRSANLTASVSVRNIHFNGNGYHSHSSNRVHHNNHHHHHQTQHHNHHHQQNMGKPAASTAANGYQLVTKLDTNMHQLKNHSFHSPTSSSSSSLNNYGAEASSASSTASSVSSNHAAAANTSVDLAPSKAEPAKPSPVDSTKGGVESGEVEPAASVSPQQPPISLGSQSASLQQQAAFSAQGYASYAPATFDPTPVPNEPMLNSNGVSYTNGANVPGVVYSQPAITPPYEPGMLPPTANGMPMVLPQSIMAAQQAQAYNPAMPQMPIPVTYMASSQAAAQPQLAYMNGAGGPQIAQFNPQQPPPPPQHNPALVGSQQPQLAFNKANQKHYVPLYCGLCRAYGCQCFYGGNPAAAANPAQQIGTNPGQQYPGYLPAQQQPGPTSTYAGQSQTSGRNSGPKVEKTGEYVSPASSVPLSNAAGATRGSTPSNSTTPTSVPQQQQPLVPSTAAGTNTSIINSSKQFIEQQQKQYAAAAAAAYYSYIQQAVGNGPGQVNNSGVAAANGGGPQPSSLLLALNSSPAGPQVYGGGADPAASAHGFQNGHKSHQKILYYQQQPQHMMPLSAQMQSLSLGGQHQQHQVYALGNHMLHQQHQQHVAYASSVPQPGAVNPPVQTAGEASETVNPAAAKSPASAEPAKASDEVGESESTVETRRTPTETVEPSTSLETPAPTAAAATTTSTEPVVYQQHQQSQQQPFYAQYPPPPPPQTHPTATVSVPSQAATASVIRYQQHAPAQHLFGMQATPTGQPSTFTALLNAAAAAAGGNSKISITYYQPGPAPLPPTISLQQQQQQQQQQQAHQQLPHHYNYHHLNGGQQMYQARAQPQPSHSNGQNYFGTQNGGYHHHHHTNANAGHHRHQPQQSSASSAAHFNGGGGGGGANRGPAKLGVEHAVGGGGGEETTSHFRSSPNVPSSHADSFAPHKSSSTSSSSYNNNNNNNKSSHYNSTVSGRVATGPGNNGAPSGPHLNAHHAPPNARYLNKHSQKFAVYESILFGGGAGGGSGAVHQQPHGAAGQGYLGAPPHQAFAANSGAGKTGPSAGKSGNQPILCRLGANCRFKRENKCKYFHPGAGSYHGGGHHGHHHASAGHHHHHASQQQQQQQQAGGHRTSPPSQGSPSDSSSSSTDKHVNTNPSAAAANVASSKSATPAGDKDDGAAEQPEETPTSTTTTTNEPERVANQTVNNNDDNEIQVNDDDDSTTMTRATETATAATVAP